MSIFPWVTEILYPPKCALCRHLLRGNQADLCGNCRQNAPWFPYSRNHPFPKEFRNIPFLDSLTAVWYYEGNVRKALHRFKFNRQVHLAPSFGRLLAVRLSENLPDGFDRLTWVPVSTVRRLQRGYDQAEMLALAVGRELGVPTVRLLKKIRNTHPQYRQATAEARRANVSGAFSPFEEAVCSGKRIVLVDDIFTTGATASECARVLRQMGAAQVHLAVAAAVRRR